MNDPRLLLMSSYLVNYPFTDRLYEGALAALAHLCQMGPTVIFSDGDVVFLSRTRSSAQACGTRSTAGC